MHKRDTLARSQARAAHANVVAGARSLQQVLQEDLLIENWQAVMDSLLFFTPEYNAPGSQQFCEHAAIVDAVAMEEAQQLGSTTTQSDFLERVQAKLKPLHIYLPPHRATALQHFPNKPPGAKRRKKKAEEEDDSTAWFLAIVEHALLQRDLKIGYEFAFGGGKDVRITPELLANAYSRIGEQPPAQSVLLAMLRDVNQPATFQDLFDQLSSIPGPL